MIDNWTKVTVGKYQEIKSIINSGAEPEVVNTELISCLTDLDVEEVLDMPLMRFNNFLQCTGFLYEDMPKRIVATKYVLGGTHFNVMLNIEEMTAAQFIDYQNYIKDIDKNIVQLLSIFLIPKGHKYNDGYDMVEVQKAIRDNLCIIDASALAAFFFGMVQRFVEGYSTLFNKEDEENDEEGDEQGSGDEDAGSDNTFGKKWKWIAIVDRVSETVRDSWEKVMQMNVYEFFNILCYAIDKANEEKKQLDNWRKKH